MLVNTLALPPETQNSIEKELEYLNLRHATVSALISSLEQYERTQAKAPKQ